MMCPDTDADILLQGAIDDLEFEVYNLIIGSCQSLAPITGRTDCVTEADALLKLNAVSFKIKMLSKFFNPIYSNDYDGTMQYLDIVIIDNLLEDYT